MDLIEPVLPELPDRAATDLMFAGWKRQLESILAQQERLAVFLPGGEYSRHHQCCGTSKLWCGSGSADPYV
jgi:hypothetical protein